MRNAIKVYPAYSLLSITEDGKTEYLLTNQYTDPLFIARRCSLAAADKAAGSMTHKAFPEAAVMGQSPKLFSVCSTAIDFDRGVFSTEVHGRWCDLPLQAVTAAADWCYERLGEIPLAERTMTFYLRAIMEWRKTGNSSCYFLRSI